MTEITTINSAMGNYAKECVAANSQQQSGVTTVVKSVWDTTSTIATTAIDGTAKIVEGTADVVVGLAKGTAAVAKLPFTLTSSLFENSKTDEKNNDNPKSCLETYLEKNPMIKLNELGSLTSASAKLDLKVLESSQEKQDKILNSYIKNDSLPFYFMTNPEEQSKLVKNWVK